MNCSSARARVVWRKFQRDMSTSENGEIYPDEFLEIYSSRVQRAMKMIYCVFYGVVFRNEVDQSARRSVRVNEINAFRDVMEGNESSGIRKNQVTQRVSAAMMAATKCQRRTARKRRSKTPSTRQNAPPNPRNGK